MRVVSEQDIDILVTYVPIERTDAVLAAIFAAGGGRIGDYTECAFVQAGTGQFRPGAGSDPTTGAVGRLERVAEHRVEVVVPRALRGQVVAALRQAHPYEEPAFHIVETASG